MYVLGDVSPGLQKVYDQLQTLPYAYASFFPNVDFKAYDPASGGTAMSLGEAIDAGVISVAQYEAAFGPIPKITDPGIASDYANMQKQTQDMINQGIASPQSLTDLTPEFYLNHFTPLAAQLGTRAGGYTQNASGATVFVDENNNVVKDAYIPPPAPTQQPTEPPRYLVGGQEFTDEAQATAAKAALDAQTAAGGSAILPPQPGGTYTADVQAQIDAEHAAADAAAAAAAASSSSSSSPSSSSQAALVPAASGPLVDLAPSSSSSSSAVPSSGGIPWGLILGGVAAAGAVLAFSRPSKTRRQPRRRRS